VIVLVLSIPFFVFLPTNPPSPPLKIPLCPPLIKGDVGGLPGGKGGLFSFASKKNLIYLLKVFTIAFCLSGFWSVPFLANLPYIAHMKWTQLEGIRELFPRPLWPAFIASAVAIFFIIRSKEKRLYFFLWLAGIMLCLYFFLPDGKLWNARFLPYLYTIAIILSAYTLTEVVALFNQQFTVHSSRFTVSRLFGIFLPVITFIGFILLHPLSYIPNWIKWNYSGYEQKKDWATLKSLMDYLDSLPSGRVMWEYRPELDKFGTPRVLELIPYFTKQPTMEGLLIESSITAPFHFIMQAETTKKPTHAVGGITYPSFSFDMGVKHMKLFNIKYFIAFSDDVRKEADRFLKPLKRIGDFSVYELQDIDNINAGYISVADDIEYRKFTGKWKDEAISWFKNGETLERPIVYIKEENPPTSPFFKGGQRGITGGQGGIKEVVEGSSNNISHVNVTNDSIEFNTNAIGIPHIVKISYFPNWKAEGAKGPYLASPSLMAVIPEKNHVRLYFARRWPDWLGIILTWSSWGFVVIALFRIIVVQNKRLLRPDFIGTRNDKLTNDASLLSLSRKHSGFGTTKQSQHFLLSIVIPAYNEEKNLKRTIEEILLYTKNHGWKTEVVIIDDGSNDGTWEVMEKIKKKHSSIIKILRNEKNEGKGSAVKKGMLNSSGEYVIFTDADLSYDLSGIELFVKELSDRYDVVIGSRRISGSELKVSVGPLRRTMSRIFSSIVNLLTGINYSDTQCGFKGFRGEVAREIFSFLTIKSFAFDVEALYIAKKQRLKIKEIPVRLVRESYITKRLMLHSIKMLADILKIRLNSLFGRYRG
jgi:dolichyl-phosphate beta-glucosyltransferase